MDVLGFFQLLNIINLLNTVFPKGIGEFVVLLTWFGFFLLIVIEVIQYALTKELINTNTRARITMEDIGVVIYPSGATKENILPKNTQTFSVDMGKDKKCTWTIEDDQWMIKSNGVRFTYFHPNIPHNISLNYLVNLVQNKQTMKLDKEGEIEFIPIANVSYTAYDQDSKIMTIAMAYAQDVANPYKKFENAAIVIAIIMAVGIAGALLFIFMPHQTTEAAAKVATTATTITTTTLQGHSGIT